MFDDFPDFLGKPAFCEQLVRIVESEIGTHIATALGYGAIDVAHESISLCCLPGPAEAAV